MKKLLSLLLAFLMVFVLFGTPSSLFAEGEEDTGEVTVETVIEETPEEVVEEEPELDSVIPNNPVNISIIHTNDMHGTLEGTGGYLKVIPFIADYKTNVNPNTIVVDAGDFSQGTPFVGFTKGSLMFEAIDGVYDIATIGNHEFDWGRDNLFANLEKAPNVSFLNANIVWKKAKVLNSKGKKVTKKNVPMFTPNKIMEVEGVKIGFFGLASEDFKFKVAPATWKNVKILNTVKVAQKQVKLLKAAGCDIIVAVAHMGVDDNGGTTSQKLRSKVPGIDVILDGHSHTLCPSKIDPATDAPPNVCGTSARDALIASQVGSLADGFGIVQISVSNVDGYSYKEEKVKVADYSAFAEDATIKAKLDAVKTEIGPTMSVVVGSTTNALTAFRTPTVTIDDSVRGGESVLGNVIADAYRIVSGADIGMMNGGGIRASIPGVATPDPSLDPTVYPYSITKGDLNTTQPYGNNVIVIKVKGKLIKEMLEHSVSAYPTEIGAFMQVSGMTFTFDPTKEARSPKDGTAGKRITSITIGGKKYNKNKYYTIAMPDFAIMGGDNYNMLKKAKVVKSVGTDVDVLIAYLESLGGPVTGAKEGRIVKK